MRSACARRTSVGRKKKRGESYKPSTLSTKRAVFIIYLSAGGHTPPTHTQKYERLDAGDASVSIGAPAQVLQ